MINRKNKKESVEYYNLDVIIAVGYRESDFDKELKKVLKGLVNEPNDYLSK